MIFIKWLLYSVKAVAEFQPRCAPSILNLFIDMMLFQDSGNKGNTTKSAFEETKHPPPVKCDQFMFTGQKELQIALIVIAMLCIPWMLLGKPLYIMLKQRSHHAVIKYISLFEMFYVIMVVVFFSFHTGPNKR